MAKQRMVNTKFWDDTYIIELESLEKLLYLYLLTNSLTNLSWIYELSIRRITFDTWIDKTMVLKIFEIFKNSNKIYYYEWWIFIRNFIKNQNSSPSIWKWIKREVENVPKHIISEIVAIDKKILIPYIDSIDTPYTPPIQEGIPNLTKPNLTKPNLNGTVITEIPIVPKVTTLELYIKKEFTIEFVKEVYNKYWMSKDDFQEECTWFVDYWREKSINWKKEKREKEKTFDPKLRFRTWMKNNKKWSNRVVVNSEDEERNKKLEDIERKKSLLFNNLKNAN